MQGVARLKFVVREATAALSTCGVEIQYYFKSTGFAMKRRFAIENHQLRLCERIFGRLEVQAIENEALSG